MMLYLYPFLNKYMVLTVMNFSAYQNIFHPILKVYRAIDFIVLLMHLQKSSFLLNQTIFPKNPGFKKVFSKAFFHRRKELTSYLLTYCPIMKNKTIQNKRKRPKCHILHFFLL